MICSWIWRAALAAGCLLAWPAGSRAEEPPSPGPRDSIKPKPDLHPGPPVPVPSEELERSIRRGVAFLLADQHKDGSWGSPELTGVEITAGIGSHQAFGTAVTALGVSALIEVDDGSEAVRGAIERGEASLTRELPRVRRNDPMLIYNVWAHAYGIQSLAHLARQHAGDPAKREAIGVLIRQQYERLARYESAQGGWGYYDFGAGTQRPNSSSTSFVNAAVLEAMFEAKGVGVAPPEVLVKRAMEATRLQRQVDFTYLYDLDLRQSPTMAIQRPGGSLGRSQACNLAMRVWGDSTVTDGVLKEWLDRLVVRNGWLDMGRKRPVPHESFFMVAGYFYYFGHYYAALCLEQLPEADRPFYQDHLARILMGVQERDGSWWDYPLYNYHRPYGTAFALMSLARCRKLGPSGPAPGLPSSPKP